MNEVNNNTKRGIGSRKTIMIVIGLVLVFALAMGGATGVYARLIDTTGAAEQTFQAPKLNCIISSEEITGSNNITYDQFTISLDQQSTNVPAYIRVKLIANWVDDQGNILIAPPEGATGSLPAYRGDAGWHVESNGLIYLNSTLEAGQSASFTVTKNENAQVTVLAEAIQAEPASAVQDAWGMSFANGVWSVAP